jgi:hypothetical protein
VVHRWRRPGKPNHDLGRLRRLGAPHDEFTALEETLCLPLAHRATLWDSMALSISTFVERLATLGVPSIAALLALL